MPQINKIRIVNFSYNDGNRFIADELYDLTSENEESLNTLFNLANGGGKTVLVQLMLQPVHPRAMAGQRHIEDYFGHSGDHSYVLIEWSTDGSDDKLLTGISMAGSLSSSTEDNRRGNTIRYYTFKTVYENDNSLYSIASLELSKNEKGKFVPATYDYIREKAKLSRGMLEYYSSDESSKWATMLEQYGIYRSEWETVIEPLNKDEGALNGYFDEAKTSDKLISKFFIPAIENKMKSVVSNGKDSSLETMLINYAKRISGKEAVIKERDTNRKLIESLSNLEEMSDTLYNSGEILTESLGRVGGFRSAVKKRTRDIESNIADISAEILNIEERIRHIEHEKKSKEYYNAAEEYERASKAFSDAGEILNRADESHKDKKHEEDILSAAKLYSQITESEGKIKAYRKRIEESENDSDDAKHIANLKFSIFTKAGEKIRDLTADIEQKNNQIREKTEEKEAYETARKKANEEYENAKDEFLGISAKLDSSKENSDEKIKKLNIEAVRRFDGFYSDKEIDQYKQEWDRKKHECEETVDRITSEIKDLSAEYDKLPEVFSDVKTEINNVTTKTKQAEEELSEYREKLEQLKKVCLKNSIEEESIFSGSLERYLRQEREMLRATTRKCEQDKISLEERLKSVNEGHVHILSEIMEYVVSTGINCRTGEEYITGLIENQTYTPEKAEEIISLCPEFAFSLLFDNEKDIVKLLSAGNVEWLPASVPIFTMEQAGEIMAGNYEKTNYLAVYDRKYFADKSGYYDKLLQEIKKAEERMQRLEAGLKEFGDDQKLVENFEYTAEWEAQQQDLINGYVNKSAELLRKKEDIQKKQERLKEKLEELRAESDNKKNEVSEANKWLESFADLKGMLDRETEYYNKEQEAFIAKNKAQREQIKANEAVSVAEKELSTLKNEYEIQEETLSKVKRLAEEVNNAKEAEVIDGEIEQMYQEYQTILGNLNESLKNLRNKLDETLKKKASDEKELSCYKCEKSEYSSVLFTPEALNLAKEAVRNAEDKVKECQGIFNDCNKKNAGAKQRFETAEKALEDYDGKALPQNDIGEDFRTRIKAAKQEIKEAERKKGILDGENRKLERIYDNVDGVLKEAQFSDNIIEVSLSDEPEKQWDAIYDEYIIERKDFFSKKEHLQKSLIQTVAEFKETAISEIVNKLIDIGDMLDNTEIKGDRLYTVNESISAMIVSIEKINNRIETDLKEIDNDFNDIVSQCMNQGRRIYIDLRMIASSSKAHIYEGKPQIQMVKMDLPEEKEISEETSRIAIASEIEQGANEIKELIKIDAESKQIHNRAKVIVSSERLLHKYIRRESVQVKVYKIDMNRANSVYKRWEDTLTQSSGAEKFVVFFSVVLTLINYNRSAAGLVSRNTKSVLILDNPFGKITSAHLLKPMFDIAKHFQVQLICLSDINKSDVISCFDCVIKLVIKSQNLSNFEIMTHEGNESIEHGFYKIMNGQMRLF